MTTATLTWLEWLRQVRANPDHFTPDEINTVIDHAREELGEGNLELLDFINQIK